MRPRYIIALIVLGAGLALLLFSGSNGSILGMESDRFAGLISVGALLIVFSAGILSSRPRMATAAKSIAIWFVIVLVMIGGYQYRYELQDIASRITAGLVPGSPLMLSEEDGRATVVLAKSPSGHFNVDVVIDGNTLRLMVDTGATSTVLTRVDASTAGLDINALSYTVPVSTANGITRAAASRVGGITIGGISRSNVPVLVAADSTLDQSLLGMNFIATLSGFDIRGDRMTLRD